MRAEPERWRCPRRTAAVDPPGSGCGQDRPELRSSWLAPGLAPCWISTPRLIVPSLLPWTPTPPAPTAAAPCPWAMAPPPTSWASIAATAASKASWSIKPASSAHLSCSRRVGRGYAIVLSRSVDDHTGVDRAMVVRAHFDSAITRDGTPSQLCTLRYSENDS